MIALFSFTILIFLLACMEDDEQVEEEIAEEFGEYDDEQDDESYDG